MKKLIKITSCIMLLFILVFTLVSCNDKKDKDEVILNYLNEYTEQKAVYSNCDIVLEKPTYSYYGDVVLTMECEGEVTTLYDSSSYGYCIDFKEDLELCSLDSKEYTLTFTIGDTFKTYNRRGKVCGLVNKDLVVNLKMHYAYILMNEVIDDIDFLKSRKEYREGFDGIKEKTDTTSLMFISINSVGEYNLNKIEFTKDSEYLGIERINVGDKVSGTLSSHEMKKYCISLDSSGDYDVNLSEGVEYNIYDYDYNAVDIKDIKRGGYYIDITNNESSDLEYTFSINYGQFKNGVKVYGNDDVAYYLFTPKTSGVYYIDYENDLITNLFMKYNGKYYSVREPFYYSSSEVYKIIITKPFHNETTINYTLVDMDSSESKYKRYEITSTNSYDVSGEDYYVLHDNIIRKNMEDEYLFNKDIVYSLTELTFDEAEYKYTIKVNDEYFVDNRGTLTELNVGDTIYKVELYKKLSSEDGLGEIVDSYWRVDNKEETSYQIGETKMIIVYDALNPRESIDFTIKPKPLDI